MDGTIDSANESPGDGPHGVDQWIAAANSLPPEEEDLDPRLAPEVPITSATEVPVDMPHGLEDEREAETPTSQTSPFTVRPSDLTGPYPGMVVRGPYSPEDQHPSEGQYSGYYGQPVSVPTPEPPQVSVPLMEVPESVPQSLEPPPQPLSPQVVPPSPVPIPPKTGPAYQPPMWLPSHAPTDLVPPPSGSLLSTGLPLPPGVVPSEPPMPPGVHPMPGVSPFRESDTQTTGSHQVLPQLPVESSPALVLPIDPDVPADKGTTESVRNLEPELSMPTEPIPPLGQEGTQPAPKKPVKKRRPVLAIIITSILVCVVAAGVFVAIKGIPWVPSDTPTQTGTGSPTVQSTLYQPPPEPVPSGTRIPIGQPVSVELDYGLLTFTVLSAAEVHTKIGSAVPMSGMVFVSVPVEMSYTGTQTYVHAISDSVLAAGDGVAYRPDPIGAMAIPGLDGGKNTFWVLSIPSGTSTQGIFVFQIPSNAVEGSHFRVGAKSNPVIPMDIGL